MGCDILKRIIKYFPFLPTIDYFAGKRGLNLKRVFYPFIPEKDSFYGRGRKWKYLTNGILLEKKKNT